MKYFSGKYFEIPKYSANFFKKKFDENSFFTLGMLKLLNKQFNFSSIELGWDCRGGFDSMIYLRELCLSNDELVLVGGSSFIDPSDFFLKKRRLYDQSLLLKVSHDNLSQQTVINYINNLRLPSSTKITMALKKYDTSRVYYVLPISEVGPRVFMSSGIGKATNVKYYVQPDKLSVWGSAK